MWSVVILTYDELDNIRMMFEKRIQHNRYLITIRNSKDSVVYKIEQLSMVIEFIHIKDISCLQSKLIGKRTNWMFVDEQIYKDADSVLLLFTACPTQSGHRTTEEFITQLLAGVPEPMYDYRTTMIKDIQKYIRDNDWINKHASECNNDYNAMLDLLYDELWANDQITGNGGNFYDTPDNCASYVMENFLLYLEAARTYQFKDEWLSWEEHAQKMDCIIRCYLLRDCLEEACNEL